MKHSHMNASRVRLIVSLSAALAFQISNRDFNSTLNDDIQPRLRIGVSLGEVIVADNTITGAGVVLAQRVEQLAEPDGLCITAALHEALPRHMPFELDDLGEQAIKGFDDPVHVYRVSITSGQSIPPPDLTGKTGSSSGKRQVVASAVIALVLASGLFYFFMPRDTGTEEAQVDVAVPLAEKPSIAVLPFNNMSDDPNTDYFSDGISEDIITDLSQLKSLAVIARNSSFTYRNTSAKVQDIGQDLGAEYLLEGSVRKAGNQIRITAQLIDTVNGHHLWAERFDRELIEMFALQDEITEKIVAALSIQLSGDEQQQLAKNATNNFEAYDHFLQGQILNARFTKEDLIEAAQTYRNVIELDPGFARAYGALAIALTRQVILGYSDSPAETKERSLEMARKAVAINPDSPQAQWALGYVYMYRNQFDKAIEALERSVSLSPSYADGYAMLALINNNLGHAEEAIRLIEKGMKLNPYYSWDYLYNLGRAYYALGDYQKATEYLQQAMERNEAPRVLRLFLIASLVQLNRLEDAEWEVMQLEVTNPEVTLSHLNAVLVIADTELLNRLTDDLRSAGLPE
ncbi:MAG: adenylate/guanylate cyclase domain-containing protein [Planctomycetota bacterium]